MKYTFTVNKMGHLSKVGVRAWQLTMFCADLRKCKLLIWRCKDDYILVDVQYNEDYVH